MTSESTRRARTLRRRSTESEALLWRRLRNRQLFNWKFRRQEPIGPYFADFACRDARLVIEIDGGQHYKVDGSPVSHDVERTHYIESMGWRMLRFTSREVLLETSAALEDIGAALSPSP